MVSTLRTALPFHITNNTAGNSAAIIRNNFKGGVNIGNGGGDPLEITNGSGTVKSSIDANGNANFNTVKLIAGTVIASATTIAPLSGITHISGTTAIATITLPVAGFTGCIKLIPDGAWTTTTTGNISLASTAVVNRTLEMCYDGTKWNPSY
jgi:hypothetical protein